MCACLIPRRLITINTNQRHTNRYNAAPNKHKSGYTTNTSTKNNDGHGFINKVHNKKIKAALALAANFTVECG